jgi:hypothetical protein
MEKSSQIAWKIVPLIHFFPLKVVPLIEGLLYSLLPLWTQWGDLWLPWPKPLSPRSAIRNIVKDPIRESPMSENT